MDVTLQESMATVLVRKASSARTHSGLSWRPRLKSGCLEILSDEFQRCRHRRQVIQRWFHALAESGGVGCGWQREEEQLECGVEKEDLEKGFEEAGP